MQESAKELAENGFSISRLQATNKPELRFRALLTDEALEVRFELTPAIRRIGRETARLQSARAKSTHVSTKQN